MARPPRGIKRKAATQASSKYNSVPPPDSPAHSIPQKENAQASKTRLEVPQIKPPSHSSHSSTQITGQDTSNSIIDGAWATLEKSLPPGTALSQFLESNSSMSQTNTSSPETQQNSIEMQSPSSYGPALSESHPDPASRSPEPQDFHDTLAMMPSSPFELGDFFYNDSMFSPPEYPSSLLDQNTPTSMESNSPPDQYYTLPQQASNPYLSPPLPYDQPIHTRPSDAEFPSAMPHRPQSFPQPQGFNRHERFYNDEGQFQDSPIRNGSEGIISGYLFGPPDIHIDPFPFGMPIEMPFEHMPPFNPDANPQSYWFKEPHSLERPHNRPFIPHPFPDNYARNHPRPDRNIKEDMEFLIEPKIQTDEEFAKLHYSDDGEGAFQKFALRAAVTPDPDKHQRFACEGQFLEQRMDSAGHAQYLGSEVPEYAFTQDIGLNHGRKFFKDPHQEWMIAQARHEMGLKAYDETFERNLKNM